MNRIGSFRIAAGHPSLDGHFPDDPIVPGVVLLDYALDLVCGVAPEWSPAAVPKMKFLVPVRPGEEVAVWAERDPTGQAMRFRCLVGERTVAEGALAKNHRQDR